METTSTPGGAVTSGTTTFGTGSAPNTSTTSTTPGVGGTAGAASLGAAVDGPTNDSELRPEDFKKDGGLRKDAIRRIEENASGRGTERSFNEITGETTVTTDVGGVTITYVEDGDTRGEVRKVSATDGLATASERAENEERKQESE